MDQNLSGSLCRAVLLIDGFSLILDDPSFISATDNSCREGASGSFAWLQHYCDREQMLPVAA